MRYGSVRLAMWPISVGSISIALRCEPLETEYDDYMTYYQKMEFENELLSFEGFFKKAHYNSDLVFAGYQSRQDFLKDFEQKFVISNAYSTTWSSKPWKIPRNFKKRHETIRLHKTSSI